MDNTALCHTELDRTTFPEWRDHILLAETGGTAQPGESRSYPGYPRWALERARMRWLVSLDRVLARRRCAQSLGTQFPSRRTLGRLLQFSHGITGPDGRGAVPSAGGLQALELYLITWQPDWLPAGVYHYDRSGHHLSQIVPRAERDDWRGRVPSLDQIEGGALLWILVGDGTRTAAKYAARGHRFLLLEAGHLMQNLCLVSASLGLTTVPLGGFFEREIASRLSLPAGDLVLYVGLCGAGPREGP
jgi:SagB-type dehydrogenase family enzyme